MALQTNVTIKIGDITITNFSNLKINQEIHAHNTFSVEVRQDFLVSEFKSVMPVSLGLYGEKVTIEIKPIEGLEDLMVFTNRNDYILHFSGIVTKIKTRKSRFEDLEETLFISGHSCSVFLDDGLKCNSFTNKSLNDIVTETKAGYDIDLNIFTFYKNLLPYTVQYNESTFDFLNRLAKRYGHYFYDNGRVMVFGAPGTSGGEPTLVYGVNMQQFDYTMKMVPSLFEIIENDNRSGDYATDEIMQYRNECDGFHQNFLNKSTTVFNQKSQLQLNQNAVGGRGKTTLEEYAKNKMRSVLSELMEIKATSEVPGITLGNTVRIKGVDVQLESTYCVTAILHFCEDQGTYENHFTAVNFNGSVFSPQTNPDLLPHCISQTAIVTANADPDGLSGVQVQMTWQQAKNKTTPYIPLLQNYGGSRGSHIIPEVGDTVLVDFQGGNAELPVVKGIMTSNKEKSSFSTPNNDLKVLATRSGNRLVMNDSAGSILVQDASNSKIGLNGDHTIDFRSDTLNIDVKKLIINASESTQITTNDYMLNALSKIYISGKEMKQYIKGFMNLCSGKVLINSSDTIDIEGKVVKTHGKEQVIVHSDEEAIINSLGTAKIHGADGNSFTNLPEPIEAAPTENIALATVYFRPLSTWKGEFGFDWLREKDNGLSTEPDYESIIESGYKDGKTNLTHDEAFDKLKLEYESIPITRQTTPAPGSSPVPTEYFVPYLTLFSEEFVDSLIDIPLVMPAYEAELKLLIDIEEDLEKLEFEYDDDLLEVDTDILSENTKTNGLEDKSITIKITCLEDLDCDQYIDIYAYPKIASNASGETVATDMVERKLAGRLKVLKNDETVRHEENFVLVGLWTATDSSLPTEYASFSTEEKENLYKALYQSLIVPIIEDTTLDLSEHPDFTNSGKFLSGSNIKHMITMHGKSVLNSDLYEKCKELFFKVKDSTGTLENEKYEDHFTVFKFGVSSNDTGTFGEVEAVGISNVIMYTDVSSGYEHVLAHEVLHGLGLYHSHRDHDVIPSHTSNYKYTFPNGKGNTIQPVANPTSATNNIMGYSKEAYSTWYWQWKIINDNII
ncbi:hypothetical protein B4N84_28365 [Flavobacterium sp. IR1]|nr:hypothetical protein B4N84_28365 [Flavobacterium sp. IR1]